MQKKYFRRKFAIKVAQNQKFGTSGQVLTYVFCSMAYVRDGKIQGQ
jgi:hypothetical protein